MASESGWLAKWSLFDKVGKALFGPARLPAPFYVCTGGKAGAVGHPSSQSGLRRQGCWGQGGGGGWGVAGRGQRRPAAWAWLEVGVAGLALLEEICLGDWTPPTPL